MGGFEAYYGQSSVHPLAMLVTLVLSVCALSFKRETVFITLFIAASCIPMQQRLVILGADITLLRFLLLILVIRIFLRSEHKLLRWRRLDAYVLMWAIFGSIIFTMQTGTFASFIYRLGWSFDILATYFVARTLIRDFDDLKGVARAIALISVPVACFFLYEWSTGYNVFSIFGGVEPYTPIREGRLRCQGAFAHPILAGTFWAATLPLVWTLWNSEHKALSKIATFSVFIIVVACASSTPILSTLVALLGVLLFKFWRYRSLMWVSLLCGLFFLHLVMEQPVWHLLARAGVVGGSTGWHRFVILDAFIRHFSEWFLIGTPKSDTLQWAWQMRDITNQYVLEGLRGGLITLLVFIGVLVTTFKNIGVGLGGAGKNLEQEGKYLSVIWLLGVAMFVHVVTFFGVSYFGQMTTLLYIQIALTTIPLKDVTISRLNSEFSQQPTNFRR